MKEQKRETQTAGWFLRLATNAAEALCRRMPNPHRPRWFPPVALVLLTVPCFFSQGGLCATPAQTGTGNAAPSVETAERVMEKMAQTYAQATSYEDTGIVLMHDPDKPGPDEIIFSTRFLRPRLFRFEWTTHHPYPPLRHIKTHAVIWSDGTGVFHSRSNPPKSESMRDLSIAVAAATGVSRNSSGNVARMLMADISGSTLASLKNPSLVGEADFDGVRCHLIRATDPRGNSCELWIGKQDFLLRKTIRPGLRPDTPTEEIRQNIRINREIPVASFGAPSK